MHNPFYIGDQPAGTQVSGWLDAWTPTPSIYAVKACSTADVVAAVDFARENNLRLAVKGAGHSYQGTSTAPDSLLIWTRDMRAVTLHDSFIPAGGEGRAAPSPAVTAGAGAVWIDLYNAVTTIGGRYVQGGGCTDTGVAGLVQSGGFGSHSKGFGTVAANLLEVEIITADGVVRTVNDYREPDLFWAIKGGGGGSWGVVTSLTLRTHALPSFFGGVSGRIQTRSDRAYRRLIERFVDFYADHLLNPYWGEQVFFAPDNSLKLSMVCHGLDTLQINEIWEPFFDWVRTSPNDFLVTDTLRGTAEDARHAWNVEQNKNLVRDVRVNAPQHYGWWAGDQEQVGIFLHGFDSLWLPAFLLHDVHRLKLVEALFAASRHKRIDLHFNKGMAGASAHAISATKETSMNPVVLNAFALAIIADGTVPLLGSNPSIDMDLARQDAVAIERAASELRRIVPNAGSYVAESNYFNAAWKQAFWGENYDRLNTIKTKYDPDDLFFVYHGVGSDVWSSDGFERVK